MNREPARPLRRPPILVDRAHSFGVGVWEPGKRGAGKLILSEDALTFVPAVGLQPLHIPLHEISRLDTAARLRGGPKLGSVLRVTYSGNLVLGLALEQPERWVNAIQALTARSGRKPLTGQPIATRFEIQRFRLIVGMFLLLIVLMSTALPLFFSWMNARVNRPANVPSDLPMDAVSGEASGF